MGRRPFKEDPPSSYFPGQWLTGSSVPCAFPNNSILAFLKSTHGKGKCWLFKHGRCMMGTDWSMRQGPGPVSWCIHRAQHCDWHFIGTWQMFVEWVNEIIQEENPVLPRIQIYNLSTGYKLVLFNPPSGTVIHLFSWQLALKELFLVEMESFQLEPGN